jgi:N,N'-diacetyllegionaminate synthase
MLLSSRCLVIGEVAQAHDGSLGTAHAYIDAIAAAGADAVKFQTHLAEFESTPAEPWRIRFSLQDATRYAYWHRVSFNEEQFAGLRNHAVERGLEFLSSPFSLEAAQMLERIGVNAWKIASGEVSNGPLLEFMLQTGKPLLLSTGMSAMEEVDAAIERFSGAGAEFAVLQCTSKYPCPGEEIGLNMLRLFRERYGCKVGLSDHSGTIFPALAAVALGANVIEVHVTLSRECFGPDVPASITTSELTQLVKGVRYIERMLNCPVEKNRMAAELEPVRNIFRKSIVLRESLPAGTVLRTEHLVLKKPGTGLAGASLQDVIGKRLTRALEADEMLHEADLAVAD